MQNLGPDYNPEIPILKKLKKTHHIELFQLSIKQCYKIVLQILNIRMEICGNFNS